MKMLRIALKNTKTTVIACLVVFVAILNCVIALCDNDITTVPDWSKTIELLIIAVGLLFARDSNKSSEDVGIK